jgi:hypothetical protein
MQVMCRNEKTRYKQQARQVTQGVWMRTGTTRRFASQVHGDYINRLRQRFACVKVRWRGAKSSVRVARGWGHHTGFSAARLALPSARRADGLTFEIRFSLALPTSQTPRRLCVQEAPRPIWPYWTSLSGTAMSDTRRFISI